MIMNALNHVSYKLIEMQEKKDNEYLIEEKLSTSNYFACTYGYV